MSETNQFNNNSVEEVAYKLATKIAAYEKMPGDARSYWLELYSQSLRVVRGAAPK